MIKRLVLLCFLISTVMSVLARADVQLAHLLDELDGVVKNHQVYDDIKKNRIDNLKRELYQASNNQERFDIYGGLFEEYKNYQMDSALVIANKRIEIAKGLTDKNSLFIAKLNQAEVLTVTGMYKEALAILSTLNQKEFNRGQKTYLFHVYHSLYMLMFEYSFASEEKEAYRQLEIQYKDSILTTIEPGQLGYYSVISSQLLAMREYKQALDSAYKCYRMYEDEEHAAAMIGYNLSEIYNKIGDKENEKKYLAISSINDIKSGVKEYISLRKLAVLLYEEGDINRAYEYMKHSLDDAIFSNARLRTLEISQMLPLINVAYNSKMQKERDRLFILLCIISVLTIILIGAVLYIYKQMHILSSIRRHLKEVNGDLKVINEELNQTNGKLSEANHVKEEYIGYLFSVCSTYINKLEDFRVKINRKLKTGQLEDLHKMTGSSSLISDELKEFYKNFDSIFLNLYPNFVEGFNSLLSEKERIIPKEGELLSPELRIFALVRLGINDSVKIAGFLHYSPQTVYNYRLKVRNKANDSKDDFLAAVSQIGKIKQ